MPATVVILACIPATVVTLLEILATVVTSDDILATVVTLLAIAPRVSILLVIDESELTFAIVGPASTAPVVALKPRTVPFLLSFVGNVIVAASSVSSNLIDLSIRSLRSSNKATVLSNSVLSVAIGKAPDVGKSVDLLNGISLYIITVLPPVAPVTDIVTVPVEPFPPLTV